MSDLGSSKENLPDWLRRWYCLKGEPRFREAADEIERLAGECANWKQLHDVDEACIADLHRQLREAKESRASHEPSARQTAAFWRDDAFENAAKICERYEAHDAARDIRHLKGSSQPPGEDYRLPCEVHLPPNTYIGKGCPLSTLLNALKIRERNPVEFPHRAAQSPSEQPSAAFRELIAILNAARDIRHWHDWGGNNEGMVVSAEHVRALWGAVAAYEKRIDECLSLTKCEGRNAS